MSGIVPYLYSGLCVIGGLAGYAKGSVASLIASSSIAVVNLLGTYMKTNDQSNGVYLQYLCGAMLGYIGGKKFLTKGSPIMGVLGVASFLYIVALTI